MNNVTQIPIDPFGNAIPVANLKTRGTQAITLTSNSTIYASNAFSSKTKTLASGAVTGTTGAKSLTLTSRIEGEQSERISVQVAGAGAALLVAVSGNRNITITPKSDSTFAQVAAAIAANPAANALVAVSYATADATAVIDATQAKAYLNGWDAGNVGCYVRMWCANDFFYGKYTEAETATKTASCPVTAKVDAWEYVEAGDKISLKSATAGAIVYVTPAKQM